MDVGIVCKVWNISSSTKKKSSVNQLRDSLGYILNAEKTDCTGYMDPINQLTRECKYIENDIKTFSGAYVGGHNVSSTNVNDAVSEMMDIKKLYGKDDGRSALHMMISLPQDESGLYNAEKLMQLCSSVLKELFPNNQAIFAIHTNTDNLHAHLIINSVGLNGRKIHQPKDYMINVVHPCVNKYAASYGFTQNPKWKMVDDKRSFKKNKMTLRKAIDFAIENSSSYEDFVEYLEENNIKVRTGKHISLVLPGMKKAIRTHNLGVNYTRDAIIERIQTRKDSFVLPDVNNHSMNDKPEDVITPSTFKLQKYKELSDQQKKQVIKLLRLGRNPWRENRLMNWQLNKIADDINVESRVQSYINYYSSDGSVQGALKGMLEAKKSASYDKTLIRYAKQKYKPILDIYKEMKQIERKSFLYEHCGFVQYRPFYEKYRVLTRRLKEGYGKEVFEVDSFLNECDERLLYSKAQISEISEEYRELYKYAKKRGLTLNNDKSDLLDIIGFYDDKKNARTGFSSADAFFLSSSSSDVVLRVIKYPTMDEQGHLVESYKLTVFDRSGEVISSVSSTDIEGDFKRELEELQKKYGVSDVKRFDNFILARENCKMKVSSVKVSDSSFNNNDLDNVNTYTFPQAVNHVGETFSPVIVSAVNPFYFAVSSIDTDNRIKVVVYDDNLTSLEVFSLPSVKKKNSLGYKMLSEAMNKYGFTEEVLEFNSISDAKSYCEDKKKDNVKVKNL